MKRFCARVSVAACVAIWFGLIGAEPAQSQLLKSLFGGKSKQQQPAAGQRSRQAARPQASRQREESQAAARRQTERREVGARTAKPQAKGQAARQSPPKEVPTIEEASPQQRAAFGQLMAADWIWSPAYKKDKAPPGDVYFRKTFTVQDADSGQVHICADNKYELFVNGRLVGSGNDWRKMDIHDIAKLLKPGTNVVAVKATNTDEGPAGLVARVLTKEKSGTYESFSTDHTWRTSVKHFSRWNHTSFSESNWLPAEDYGLFGAVLPWGDEVVIGEEGARFVLDPEFAIERLTTDDQTGSLIAMSFNADGDILTSQEGGPLLLVRDRNEDGKFESVDVFSDRVTTVQGILSLGSRVYAVGDGPDGSALYRLTDNNRDGQADEVQTLVRFRGSAGEHGPHAVRIGPNGLLYVMIGNFARVDMQPSSRSPYAHHYEGDLVQPRQEDPRGHAVDVPAPGGTVIRTDTRGSFVEVVAGGLRNSYDFAFNDDGQLLTFDADMEWDLGTPWYRPTRITHVTPGSEFGWRSGWAKWPDHYLDSLPAILELGGGSPTGVEFYNHLTFPARLHNTLFVGDWARGLIHAIQLEPDGGSFKAKSSVFLKGRPLNVTDLAVGPDGALYFCTGGRGTDGGIYRVRWTGTVPKEVTDLGHGIEQALRQPQFDADWARSRISVIKRQLGDRWARELQRAATDRNQPVAQRRRAVELLVFFGPAPTSELLLSLSQDAEPKLRMQAAQLMGLRTGNEISRRLAAMLRDENGMVRRTACEAIAHRGQGAPVDALIGLLADPDRFVAFAARRALETLPAEEWQRQILDAPTSRVFFQGATGLLVAYPSKPVALAVLRRSEAMLRGDVQEPGRKPGFISDADFLDLLRVIQLALLRGQVTPEEIPSLGSQVAAEFPTSNALMNRELVKLLAYLKPPRASALLAARLSDDIPEVEKLQIAAYAPHIHEGWQTEDKLLLLRYFETARALDGGYSVSAYVENFARDFFTNLSLPDRQQVLAVGESYPASALSVLAKLPDEIPAEMLAEIRELDQRLEGKKGDVFDRLRVGIVAVLGGSADPSSVAYLHKVYHNQPERRAPVAMSLTQNPDGENWELLVDSLRTLEGTAARDVLHALADVDRRPRDADPYRHVILLGLRLGDNGGDLAAGLLEHWTGEPAPSTSAGGAPTVDAQLASWQAWYGRTFPQALPPELPQDSGRNKWSYEELLSFLESTEGRSGDPSRGAIVFQQAQCIKCHRMGNEGESLGPDLTTVSQRFQRKEILESIIYPSHVVSDQYASHAVVANGRTYVGIAVREGTEAVIVLTSDGQKVRLASEDVEEIKASSKSAMPDGLLNPLTLEQVADLFAYLEDGPTANVAGRDNRRSR